MTKRRRIDDWTIERLFGVPILCGWSEDEHHTFLLRWGSNACFGISYGGLGTDEILTEGRPGRWIPLVDMEEN